MRFLILLLALLVSSAQAQTTTTGRYYLTGPDGATIAANLQYNTDCKRIAAQNAAAAKAGSKTYSCNFAITIVYPTPAPPKPADVTRVVQCVSPAVGSWTQTATWTLDGVTWVQGPFAPAAAPAGACVTPPVTTWSKLVDENASFTLAAGATVRFGKGTAWVQKDFGAGTFSCSLSTFGTDPAVNTFKECDTSAATTTPPPVDPPPTQPTGKLQVTRTSCTAPCGVLFDASGLGDFRATYTFDFGDPKPDTWAVSGKSKNSESGGPIAAHVYLTAGTYTAKVNGESAQIVVADPAVVYAGTKTVCVGKSFAGCPSGAAQQASLPSGTAWSGKRWLLQAGATFGDISILDGNANVQVGSFGTGAKPIVASVGIGNWRPSSTNFASDIVVMDLNVQNQVQQSIGQRVLILRNYVHLTPNSGGIPLSFGEFDYWYRGDTYRTVPQSAFYNAREIFFVENNAIGADTKTGVAGFWGDGSRVALLGNRLGKYQQHTARFSALDRSVIAHNELQGISADGIRHSLKLHSMGFNAYADGAINDTSGRGGWKTSKVVIANNVLGNAADNNVWTAIIGPQNNTVGEGIEDVIVEGNQFVRGKNTQTDLIVQARRVTARGNVTPDGKLRTGSDPNPEVPAEWSGPNFLQ